MSTRALRSLFLEKLSDEQVQRLKFDWPLWARLKQRPPLSDWRTWLVLGERGAGKTRTGAEWLKGVALGDPHFPGSSGGRIALVGTNYDDIRDVMIEGESGLLAISQLANLLVRQGTARRLARQREKSNAYDKLEKAVSARRRAAGSQRAGGMPQDRFRRD